MLDGYRLANGTDFRQHFTSPIAAGMSTYLDMYLRNQEANLKEPPDPRFPKGYPLNPYHEASDSGDAICKVIEHIKKEGSCDHLRLSGMLGGTKKPLKMFKSLSISDALKQFDSKTAEFVIDEYGYPIDRKGNRIPAYMVAGSCDRMNPAEYVLNDLGLDAVDQVLDSKVFEISFLQAEVEIIRNRCKGHRIKVSAPACQYHEFVRSKKSSKEVLSKLHELASRKNPTPIGIAYCPGIRTLGKGVQGVPFFNEPHNMSTPEVLKKIEDSKQKFKSIYPQESFIHPMRCQDDMTGHGSVIIGRRRNPKTGQCQFKLRDTYGGNCSMVSSDWECSRKGMWIDDIDLAKNTTSAYSL